MRIAHCDGAKAKRMIEWMDGCRKSKQGFRHTSNSEHTSEFGMIKNAIAVASAGAGAFATTWPKRFLPKKIYSFLSIKLYFIMRDFFFG